MTCIKYDYAAIAGFAVSFGVLYFLISLSYMYRIVNSFFYNFFGIITADKKGVPNDRGVLIHIIIFTIICFLMLMFIMR